MEIAIDPQAFGKRDILKDRGLIEAHQKTMIVLMLSMDHALALSRYCEFLGRNASLKLAKLGTGQVLHFTTYLSEWVYSKYLREEILSDWIVQNLYVGEGMEDAGEFGKEMLKEIFGEEANLFIENKEKHLLYINNQRQIVLTTLSPFYSKRRLEGEEYSSKIADYWVYGGVSTIILGEYSEENEIRVCRQLLSEGKQNIIVLTKRQNETWSQREAERAIQRAIYERYGRN